MIPAKWGGQALFTEAQASEIVCVPVKTLQAYRYKGAPLIPFTRIGSSIRYRRIDLEAFLGGLEDAA